MLRLTLALTGLASVSIYDKALLIRRLALDVTVLLYYNNDINPVTLAYTCGKHKIALMI
jgi:hypothetical protein